MMDPTVASGAGDNRRARTRSKRTRRSHSIGETPRADLKVTWRERTETPAAAAISERVMGSVACAAMNSSARRTCRGAMRGGCASKSAAALCLIPTSKLVTSASRSAPASSDDPSGRATSRRSTAAIWAKPAPGPFAMSMEESKWIGPWSERPVRVSTWDSTAARSRVSALPSRPAPASKSTVAPGERIAAERPGTTSKLSRPCRPRPLPSRAMLMM
jgi:hypothetical protein